MARSVLIVSVFLTGLTLLLNLVAVAIPYWLYTDDPQLEHQGLWLTCPFSTGSTDCKLFKLAPEFIDATRVMMLFGTSLYFFSLCFGLTYLCCRPEKPKYSTAAIVMMTIGSTFCLIGVIVYGAKYSILIGADTQRLHVGFALAVVTTVLGYVTAFFFCVSRHREE